MNQHTTPAHAHEARPDNADPAQGEAWLFAQSLVFSRRNVSSRRLHPPGPDHAQLHALLTLAAAAPDHGQLTPWRFVIVPGEQRHRLAEVFALALTDRDPAATPEQAASAREKAHRAPLLLVAIACLGKRDPDTPSLERMVCMGAAVQNLLLGANAMGFGSGLTSGKAMVSDRLRALLGLQEDEQAVCCVNIGTAGARKAQPRSRPDPSVFTSTLGGTA